MVLPQVARTSFPAHSDGQGFLARDACVFPVLVWADVPPPATCSTVIYELAVSNFTESNKRRVSLGAGLPRRTRPPLGYIPGSERCPGRGNGNPLQYSCLENPMDRGAWRATVVGCRVRHDWSDSVCTHISLGVEPIHSSASDLELDGYSMAKHETSNQPYCWQEMVIGEF